MTRGHAAFSGLFLTSTWPVLVLAFLAGLFSATALPPFSLMGIPALLAIIPSLVMPILCKILLPPFWFPVLASTLWTLSEYLRGHIFSGFPWNLPAYMLSFSDSILQTASLVGVYGLSWLLMLFTAGPTLFFARELWGRPYYRVFITL